MLFAHPIYTAIPVEDLDRAKSWYQEKLGLQPSQDPPLPNGEEGIYFDAAGGTRFFLYPTRANAGAGHTIAEFAVGDDFDVIIKELRENGVVFEDHDFPGFKTVEGVAELEGPQAHRVAWFKDSEGNIIAIGSY